MGDKYRVKSDCQISRFKLKKGGTDRNWSI